MVVPGCPDAVHGLGGVGCTGGCVRLLVPCRGLVVVVLGVCGGVVFV